MLGFVTWKIRARSTILASALFVRLKCVSNLNCGSVIACGNTNMRVPLQLQVLESDFLDSAKSTVGENGNIIRQGIEFDSFNRRVAYWMEQFRPGMIEYLHPGEDIRFGNPTSDGNYESYERVQLHAIAAGLGITYEQLTGDLSQVNYSSLRAGLLEFRSLIEMLRWQVFIPKVCAPVWRRFIERAFIAGGISKIDYAVTWTPPKFEMIDPLKDAQADTMMMRNGTLTLKEAIARHGFNPEQQLQEIADTAQKLDEFGLVLDSDPRTTAKSGVVQTPNDGASNDQTTKPSNE